VNVEDLADDGINPDQIPGILPTLRRDEVRCDQTSQYQPSTSQYHFHQLSVHLFAFFYGL
jgi:hypothetical protein